FKNKRKWTYNPAKDKSVKKWIETNVYPFVYEDISNKLPNDIISFFEGNDDVFTYRDGARNKTLINDDVLNEYRHHLDFKPWYGEEIGRFSEMFNLKNFKGDDPIVIKHGDNDYSLFVISDVPLSFKASRNPGKIDDKFNKISGDNIFKRFQSRSKAKEGRVKWNNNQNDLSKLVLAILEVEMSARS
ncbi:unnamed protein product, partial [marine sediment metagenome]